MRIDWWTLALQAVNVLILVWLLGRFLFRPVMDAIAARQASAQALLDAVHGRLDLALLLAGAPAEPVGPPQLIQHRPADALGRKRLELHALLHIEA